MRRLVIDDIRNPNFEATVVRDVKLAYELIKEQPWDEVWLDHDMDLTLGSPDVSWLTDRLESEAYTDGRIYPVGLFVLHSANTYGRQRMRAALDKFYQVIDIERYPDDKLELTSSRVVDVSVRDGIKFSPAYNKLLRNWWSSEESA